MGGQGRGDLLQVVGIPERDDRAVVEWCKLSMGVAEVGGVLLGVNMGRSG